MIVTLLGVRGSRPVSMMENLRYGGNTTSFKIESHNHPPIYVDGGTGLYEEGIRLAKEGIPKEIIILITHTHWDHILSFPFFAPLYDENCHVYCYAAVSRKQRFVDLIQGQHNPKAFPVPYEELRSKQTFIDAKSEDSFEFASIRMSALQLNHPGTTLGWRVEADDRSVAIVTDNAPIEDNYLGEGMIEAAKDDPKTFEKEWNARLIRFMKNADLAIYDTHFTEEAIKNRRHWGHSTPEIAIDFCLKANAKRLILHHHAPEDTDKDIDEKAERAWQVVRDINLQVEPATEGMKIWL